MTIREKREEKETTAAGTNSVTAVLLLPWGLANRNLETGVMRTP